MLIKSELYNKFNIFIIDKCMEGILGDKPFLGAYKYLWVR